MKKIIGICSANVQRSGTFEAVMEYERRAQVLEDLVITSAGINVEKILTNTSPLKIQINILRAGLHYGLVRDEIRQTVKSVVEKGYDQEHTDQIRALYAEVRPLVHGACIAYRNQALQEAGITDFPPPYTKFDPKQDYNLVLPMDSKDTEKVEAKYSGGSGKKAAILSYGQLLGIEDLADNMAGGLEGARRTVTYFMDTRRKAIEKMREYTN